MCADSASALSALDLYLLFKLNTAVLSHTYSLAVCHRQLLLAMAEWLCQYSRTDQQASRLISAMHLYLLPSSNPDGFHSKTRQNK